MNEHKRFYIEDEKAEKIVLKDRLNPSWRFTFTENNVHFKNNLLKELNSIAKHCFRAVSRATAYYYSIDEEAKLKDLIHRKTNFLN